MPFITQGKANLKYILIVVILAAIVGGGILAYQYWWAPKKETTPPEVKVPENGVPEEVTTSEINLKTTKLATIPNNYELAKLLTGERIYLPGQKAEEEKTLADELEEERANNFFIVFSPDGRKVAYMAKEGGKWFVVVNNKTGKDYDSVGDLTSTPIFSPDSKMVAYTVREGEKNFVVINEEEGKAYGWIFDIIFSPDSKKLAYAATGPKEKEAFLVVGEKEGKNYDLVFSPVFSSDSQNLAYVAAESPQIAGDIMYYEKNFVVVNDKEGKNYEVIPMNFPTSLVFSPDGKKIAYEVQQNHEGFIVLNGIEDGTYKEYGPYDWVMWDPPLVFSPDSKHFAFTGKNKEGNKRAFVVIDGKENKAYNQVGVPVFSPDNTKLAYAAYIYIPNASKWFMVINEKEGKAYEDIIGGPVFSPDSKQLGYIALENKKYFVVISDSGGENYKESERYDLTSLPVFSPNSKNFAYIVRKEGKWQVVVNGKESGKSYDRIWDPVFSSDSKYVAYGARNGNELWWIVERVE